jgi:hypothetical protein
MIKEEWRIHKSMIGAIGSSMFPVLIFTLSAFIAFVGPFILRNIDKQTILLFLHVASAFYGLFVGSLGNISEHVMTRRLGQLNILLQLPDINPVSVKKMTALFYIKDILFYVVYSFVPLIGGIAVFAPHADVTYRGVGLLGVTLFLTFLMSMSLSFFTTAISSMSDKLKILVRLGLLGLVSGIWPFGFLNAEALLIPLGFWVSRDYFILVLSFLASMVLSVFAISVLKESYEIRQEIYKNSLSGLMNRFGFTGDLKLLVAKEWIELIRGHALVPVTLGFLGHLLALYIGIWLFESAIGLPISFNVVFYSGFIGFLGITSYSWLNNLEHNEYLNVQPVTVDQVVKAKLILYFLLTSGITAGYVTLIAVLKNEVSLLLPGLFVAFSTSFYVVAVTSYLTGLWTNTMFFDAKVLLKFAAVVVPPLSAIEIGSFMLFSKYRFAFVMEIGVSLLLFVVAVQILMRLPKKWGNVNFTFVKERE